MRRINELFLKISKILTSENANRRDLSILLEELWDKSDRRMQKFCNEIEDSEPSKALFSLENLKNQYMNLETSSTYLTGRTKNEFFLHFIEFYYQVSSLEQKYQDARIKAYL